MSGTRQVEKWVDEVAALTSPAKIAWADGSKAEYDRLVDDMLRDAWRSGVILCGLSAGSLCWYSQGVTSFHGESKLVRGLGLLPWSNCVHYGTKQGRKDVYHDALRRGMCPGYAAEDGAALHFRGSRLVEAVSSRVGAQAWCVGDGGELDGFGTGPDHQNDAAGQSSP